MTDCDTFSSEGIHIFEQNIQSPNSTPNGALYCNLGPFGRSFDSQLARRQALPISLTPEHTNAHGYYTQATTHTGCTAALTFSSSGKCTLCALEGSSPHGRESHKPRDHFCARDPKLLWTREESNPGTFGSWVGRVSAPPLVLIPIHGILMLPNPHFPTRPRSPENFWWQGQNRRTGELGWFPRALVSTGRPLGSSDISRPIKNSFIHTGHGGLDQDNWGQPGHIDDVYLRNPMDPEDLSRPGCSGQNEILPTGMGDSGAAKSQSRSVAIGKSSYRRLVEEGVPTTSAQAGATASASHAKARSRLSVTSSSAAGAVAGSSNSTPSLISFDDNDEWLMPTVPAAAAAGSAESPDRCSLLDLPIGDVDASAPPRLPAQPPVGSPIEPLLAQLRLYQNLPLTSQPPPPPPQPAQPPQYHQASSLSASSASLPTAATTTTPHELLASLRSQVPGAGAAECLSALMRHNGDLQAASRRVKIDQLLRLGLADAEACQRQLELSGWSVEEAGAALVDACCGSGSGN